MNRLEKDQFENTFNATMKKPSKRNLRTETLVNHIKN